MHAFIEEKTKCILRTLWNTA